MKRRIPVVWVAALLLSAGCISKHAGVPSPDCAWVRGKTTRLEVVTKWGNPDRTEGDTWIWRDWNLTGSKIKAAYMMVGVTVANSAASTREHRLTFGADGRLASHEVVDSVPGGARWSVWPW